MWRDDLKPSSILRSIGFHLLWMGTTIALYFSEIFVFLTSLFLQFFVVLYTFYKHHTAPKIWLRSYSGNNISVILGLVSGAENIINGYKRLEPSQWFVRQWKKFSIRREDRWDRAADDLVLTERLEAERNSPQYMESNVVNGLAGRLRTAIQLPRIHADFSDVLEDEYAAVFRELATTLSRINTTEGFNGTG
jgi:hypothetical protein